MKYVALLRGINVGTTNRIDMKQLKALFEGLGYSNVSTYINSGNIRFESEQTAPEIRSTLETSFREQLRYEIPTLVKSLDEMQRIAAEIPAHWQNDDEQRTDVAYLFDEIDSIDIIDALPFNINVVNVRYTPGAVVWNLSREHYTKSRLNKLIGHRLYQSMTLRNVNTARRMAEE